MPANVYECMFLLDTTKVAGDLPTADRQLRTILERNNAEVLVSRPWDERRLTYPIHKQKKGSYHIVYYRMDSLKQAELERDLKLNENLLRHMTLAVDPKWSDAVMVVYRFYHVSVYVPHVNQ